MDIIINGERCWIDYDKIKQEVLFFEYRELLWEMVIGDIVIGCKSKEVVDAANKHIYENYEKYRQFINQ